MTYWLWFFDDFKVVIRCFKISISHAKKEAGLRPLTVRNSFPQFAIFICQKTFRKNYTLQIYSGQIGN